MSKPDARAVILDTAERLFAERGMDAVSLRTINTEAGYSVAALHYHFGTREKLIDALLADRQRGVMARRQEILDALSDGETPSLRNIVEALVLPFADLILDDPERGLRTVKFFFRAFVEQSGRTDVRALTQESYRIFDRLLERALPGIERGTLQIRWAIAADLAFQGLANIDKILGSRGQRPTAANHRAFVDELIDFFCGGLSAGAEVSLQAKQD
jgi:AcrR family transcriptional regulator